MKFLINLYKEIKSEMAIFWVYWFTEDMLLKLILLVSFCFHVASREFEITPVLLFL